MATARRSARRERAERTRRAVADHRATFLRRDRNHGVFELAVAALMRSEALKPSPVGEAWYDRRSSMFAAARMSIDDATDANRSPVTRPPVHGTMTPEQWRVYWRSVRMNRPGRRSGPRR